MNKNTITAIIVALILIVIALLVKGGNNKEKIISKEVNVNNVSIIDGVQIIEIEARGGYNPRFSKAKSGISTIVRFNTRGTFDCSSFIRIPSLNITETLPQTGATDIDLGIPEAGDLNVSCGMGMYPFDIEFE